jgi:hypothetical protein
MKRKRIQQNRTINYMNFDLAREYSVGEMSKFLKKHYDLDFHNTDAKNIKFQAINQEDYLLDIAHDVKELLTDKDPNKYYYIDTLLSEFKRNTIEQ